MFTGAGQIVEFGPWLGSLTNALAEGLKQNKAIKKTSGLIETYDHFEWNRFMEHWVAGSNLEGVFEVGDRFLDEYKRRISDQLDLVSVHVSNLETTTWKGKPIELLVNDAWKSLPIVRNTVFQFFPNLIPEKSYVAHQDYLWITESFIHIAMYRLRRSFEFRLRIPESTMVVFRCIDKQPDLIDFFPLTFSEFCEDEIEEAFAWSQSILPAEVHQLIKAAKAWMLAQIGNMKAARRLFLEIEADRTSLNSLYQFQKSFLLRSNLGDQLRLRDIPWYFYDCLRWREKFPDEMSEITYRDAKIGWLWTGEASYPHFLRLETKEWLRYYPGTANPRRFLNEATGLQESF